MRIGIVCPYSFDAPGGVQFHVRDVAAELRDRGHFVRVLAPAEGETPDWLDSVGSSFAVPFNGSVARLAYGPRVSRATAKWLDDGDFDVVHVHEPGTPSVGLIALKRSKVPTVATFHSAMERSRLRTLTAPLFEPVFDKIAARIAVSDEALRTLVEHHGGDAVVIPNGVFTDAFRKAEPDERWQQTSERPVFVFLGRLDESRKGLGVFAGAVDQVLQSVPGTRFLVAGRGDAGALQAALKAHPGSVEVLGEVTDEEKARLLAGATAYVAPQLGGESFGIVLVEAMAAGTLVVASDLAAFDAVLDGGNAGVLFPKGDSEKLAEALVRASRDPLWREHLARAGSARSDIYDWSSVTDRLMAVYDAVLPYGPRPHTGTAYEQLSERFGVSGEQ